MIKKIAILFLLIFSITNLYSQEFYGGILGGFNGSQVEGDKARGYNKLGLSAGAWVQRDVSPKLYWGMELKYNQKGSRKFPTQLDNWKYVFRLNYIDLPVLAGYRIKPYLSVFAGLSYGYLVSKGAWDNYGLSPVDQYDYISNWELGMLAGFKIDFDQLVQEEWARKFVLETRFQYSALSIDNAHDLFSYYLSIGQFNNVISTTLYYRVKWGQSE